MRNRRFPIPAPAPYYSPEDPGGANPPGSEDPPPSSWTPPEGFPAEFVGKDADESLGKLLEGYTGANTRAEGLRTKLAEMPKAPDKPELYTFAPSDKTKPYFPGDLEKNPALQHARTVFHKHGIPDKAFGGIIEDMYAAMGEAGMILPPYDPAAEVSNFAKLHQLDKAGAEASFKELETFANGLAGQLKLPEAIAKDAAAQLVALTDTAAGNTLLKALQTRLADSGITVAGQGANQDGPLSREELQKMAADPRIDPANRHHPDPNKRFDEDLRKKYDQGYAALAQQSNG